MASKRRLRRKACGAKLRFNSHEEALIFLQERHLRGMAPYPCGFCGHYHVGHPNRHQRQAITASKDKTLW